MNRSEVKTIIKAGVTGLAVAAGVVTSLPAIGAPDNFECRIVSAVKLSDSGTLNTDETDWLVGKVFHVDRRTGVLISRHFNPWGDAQVLWPGNEHSALHVLWIERGGMGSVFVSELIIQVFQKSEAKPFLFVDGTWKRVLSGTCR